jgi:hypothetical protein
MYRGLLMYGELTRRHEFVERVALTYAVGVRGMLKHSGFISHDWGRDGRGETTSPGDAAQIALRLGRLGYSEYFDDAERLVRCRILPSQIIAPPGLKPVEGSGDDVAMLDERAVGAFGGMHGHPHGLGKPTTDITAADLHTLCDVYEHTIRDDGTCLRVDFHFDCERPCGSVAVERGGKTTLTIRPSAQRPLFVRIPSWAPRASLHASVDGTAIDLVSAGRYSVIGIVPAGSVAHVQYDLPDTTEHETVGGIEYEIRWRGDDVVGIRPNAPGRPFYPSLDAGPAGA